MKKILFIVGPSGSEKDYLIHKIKQEISLLHLDIGSIIENSFALFSTKDTLEEWIDEGEFKFGKNFTDSIVCNQIERFIRKSKEDTLIISGSKSIDSVLFISNYFNIETPKILYISYPYELLKKNYEERKNICVKDEEFIKLLSNEKEKGLKELEDYALNNPKTCHCFFDEDNNDCLKKYVKSICLY